MSNHLALLDAASVVIGGRWAYKLAFSLDPRVCPGPTIACEVRFTITTREMERALDPSEGT